MSTEIPIDPASSLGALVAERPARAGLFEALRLDYCCGGRQTLAEACARRGIDLDTVTGALAALGAEASQSAVERTDWREVSTIELCAHIVTVHHDGLREMFPRLERLLATVVRAHGDSDPRLRDAHRLFGEIRGQLEPHLASEEEELFAACVAYEQKGTPVDEGILQQHEREHTELGEALTALRVLCRDYDRDNALCDAHRALLDALEAFELDLHRHVHEENNILLPRGRQPRPTAKTEPAPPAVPTRAAAARQAEPLPPCCERWIAEQTHSWVTHQRRR